MDKDKLIFLQLILLPSWKGNSDTSERGQYVSRSVCRLCNVIDCSLSDSSVHAILQARILEWAAISSSRGSSSPRDQTQVSCIAGIFFTI